MFPLALYNMQALPSPTTDTVEFTLNASYNFSRIIWYDIESISFGLQTERRNFMSWNSTLIFAFLANGYAQIADVDFLVSQNHITCFGMKIIREE